MKRSLPALLAAALSLAWAQDQAKPGELQRDRTPPKTSGKREVPPEEDKAFLREKHDFNPLQSQKCVETGDFYLHKGKVQAAANRYQEATMYNDGNAIAWLKLARADEKLRDAAAARDAYTRYLSVAPEAKDAAEIRKKLDKLK
jgi:predicted Zn-dependent protease